MKNSSYRVICNSPYQRCFFFRLNKKLKHSSKESWEKICRLKPSQWVKGAPASSINWRMEKGVIMANLSCKLECIWNQLKAKLPDTPMRESLNQITLSRKSYLLSVPDLLVTAHIKGHWKKQLWFLGLLALTLSGRFIFSAVAVIKSFFRLPA